MQTYVQIKNELVAVSEVINAVSKLLNENERIEAIKPDQYEYRYFITDHGRVISAYNSVKGLKPTLLATPVHTYARTGLYDPTTDKMTTYTVHSLVAEAFCHKPSGRVWCDHVNEVKSDNHYLNLRWVSPADNSRSYHRTKRGDNKKWSRSKRPIIGFCVSGDGSYITYASVNLVRRTGFNPVAIAHALGRRTKTSYAFKWRYLTDEEIINNTYEIHVKK